MFRILLILGVFLALLGAGTSAAADGVGRPDGRLLPDSADIHPTAPATRPDDRDDRFIRPDGRLVPDAVDARRNAVTPVVIRVDDGATASFDWFAALIGGLVVAGVALTMGGLLIVRQHGPTLAR